MSTGEPILLVAVSARMLARLAIADRRRVVAVDRFGDRDLRVLCESISPPGPAGSSGMAEVVEAAAGIDAPAFVYGAGLENRPEWVARLTAGRELLGNRPEVLHRVREPRRLAAALADAGLPYPTTIAAAEAPSPDWRRRAWLRKPLRGGGGRGVRGWRGGALGAGEVVQARIDGLACSVAAVADGRSAAVLGVSEQLVGEGRFGSSGYGWCGNLFPARLHERERGALADRAAQVCECLAAAFGLRGLFGVDLVWDGERAWTVEVNPRPTGSLEAIEEVAPCAAFERHLRSLAGELGDSVPPPSGRAAGKAIVFAPTDSAVRDSPAWDAAVAAAASGRPARPPAGDVSIRDVPHPGERIGRGGPVCTLVATERTPEAVHARLAVAARRVASELLQPAEAHVAG